MTTYIMLQPQISKTITTTDFEDNYINRNLRYCNHRYLSIETINSKEVTNVDIFDVSTPYIYEIKYIYACVCERERDIMATDIQDITFRDMHFIIAKGV
jgi:hypothetical protein